MLLEWFQILTVAAGEFSIDLYTMPDVLTTKLWEHLVSKTADTHFKKLTNPRSPRRASLPKLMSTHISIGLMDETGNWQEQEQSTAQGWRMESPEWERQSTPLGRLAVRQR